MQRDCLDLLSMVIFINHGCLALDAFHYVNVQCEVKKDPTPCFCELMAPEQCMVCNDSHVISSGDDGRADVICSNDTFALKLSSIDRYSCV